MQRLLGVRIGLEDEDLFLEEARTAGIGADVDLGRTLGVDARPPQAVGLPLLGWNVSSTKSGPRSAALIIRPLISDAESPPEDAVDDDELELFDDDDDDDDDDEDDLELEEVELDEVELDDAPVPEFTATVAFLSSP